MRIAITTLIICLALTSFAQAQDDAPKTDVPSKSALKLQIKELKKNISSEAKEAEKVQDEISEYQSELGELETALSVAESAYEEKKALYDSNEFEKKEEALKELEDQAKDNEKQISKLEKTISKAEATEASQKEAKRASEAARDEVSLKITSHKASMALITDGEEKKVKENELKDLEKQKKGHAKDISKAEDSVKDADKEKESAETEKAQAAASLKVANDKIEKIEKEMEGLDPKSLMKEVVAFEKQKSVLKLDVDKKRSQLSEAEMILMQKNGVIDENKAKLAKLEQQLKNL